VDTTRHLNMTTPEITMETQENGPESFEAHELRSIRQRTDVSKAIGHVPEIAGGARNRAGQVAERAPGGVRPRAISGRGSTMTRLQTMPDSALRLLAAASLGLGAGLRLAGAPRLVTLAGFAAASVLGFAIHVPPTPISTWLRTRPCRSTGASLTGVFTLAPRPAAGPTIQSLL